MDPFTVSALVSGGFGLGSGILGGLMQSSENRYNFKRQKELLQLQQDYNTTMWQRNNEYNTPLNQLHRLLATGMSPNAAVNALTGGVSNAPAATPSVGTPANTGSATQAAMSGFSALMDALATVQQVRSTEQQIQGQQIANASAQKDLEAKDDFISLTKDQMSANIRSSLAGADLSNAQKYRIEYEATNLLPALKDKTVSECDKINQDLQLGVVQLANLVKTGSLLQEQIKTQRATQSQIYEQIRGQQFDNKVRELHSTLAQQFGIDIDSGTIQLLVEMALSDNAQSDAAVKKVCDTLTGVISKGLTDVPKSALSGVADGVSTLAGDSMDWLLGKSPGIPRDFNTAVDNLFRSVVNPSRTMSKVNTLPKLR